MTSFLDDLSRAALPVAISLLILTALARAALAARIDDPELLRTARLYVEPLSTWCLIAVVTYAVGLGATGDAEPVKLLPALGMALVAVLLRPGGGRRAPEVEEEPPAAEAPAQPPAPVPRGGLWAGEDVTPRRGLWSRDHGT